MLETSSVWVRARGAGICAACVLSACAAPEVSQPPEPAKSAVPAQAAQPPRDENAMAEQARAMLAQAETDIQRARSQRALWLKAWEALVLARQRSKLAHFAPAQFSSGFQRFREPSGPLCLAFARSRVQ